MSCRLLPLLLATLAACSDGGDAPPSHATPPDSAAAAREAARVVLMAGPLRIAPSLDAGGVADAAAGTALRMVGDTAVGTRRWVRLATWDDRAGWMPASAVLEPGLWAHYVQALGGAPPSAIRPAYPVGDDGWAVEKPFPSSDFDPPAGVRLAADSLVVARVVRTDTLAVGCTGAVHTVAVLDRGAPRGAYPGAGDLAKGVIAIPTNRSPTAAALPVGTLEPGERLLEAVTVAANAALEAGPDPDATLPPGVPPPPRPGADLAVEWQSAGAAAWAVASWTGAAGEPPGRWAAAFVAAPDGAGWRVRPAIPLRWTSAGGDRPPWLLVSAVATVPDRPTLLAVEAIGREGARVDLLIADDAGYRRYYTGFYHGC